MINEKEYGECNFCNAPCPSRDLFKEPDSGLPLRCDMCESDPPLEEPMCVKWCLADALVYEEREEEAQEEEEVKEDELELGLELMADKYGLDKLIETIVRMAESREA